MAKGALAAISLSGGAMAAQAARQSPHRSTRFPSGRMQCHPIRWTIGAMHAPRFRHVGPAVLAREFQ